MVVEGGRALRIFFIQLLMKYIIVIQYAFFYCDIGDGFMKQSAQISN